MELDRWIGSYKVRSFPWIDGKRIYFNVQYYAPGQSKGERVKEKKVERKGHQTIELILSIGRQSKCSDSCEDSKG